jgi:hypothetical protein
VFSIRSPYEVIVGNFSFTRKLLRVVSVGLREVRDVFMRTLKISAPLSQNSFGSIPAFAAALCTYQAVSAFQDEIPRSSHLQAMLICSRTEQRILSFQYMPSLDDVRKDHCVQVAHMRGSIDIEYRGGDVVRLLGRWLRCNVPSITAAMNLAR